MAEKLNMNKLKEMAKKGVASIDMEEVKVKTKEATSALVQKAGEVKDAAIAAKDDLTEKLTELDRMLAQSITEYNDAYTLMNDKGVMLFMERKRAIDTVNLVENIVNSIANKPKSFEKDIEEINTDRKHFIETIEFADRELKDAREAATAAGAGLAAGASVAFMAPSAAMWIATTFGTASTGAAISTLSGAASTQAALAWLGGGALSAGGGGVVAGKALIALSGPIGWSIAGATLLGAIVLFTTKRTKMNKEKNEEILALKNNIEIVKEMDEKINLILNETVKIKDNLNDLAIKALSLYNADYSSLNSDQKLLLGSLVNNTKALSAMFTKTIEE